MECKKRLNDTFSPTKSGQKSKKLVTDSFQYCCAKAGFGYGAGERAQRRVLFPVKKKNA